MRATTTALILSATLALSACSTISSVASTVTGKVKSLFGSDTPAQTVPAAPAAAADSAAAPATAPAQAAAATPAAAPAAAAAPADAAPATGQGSQRAPLDIDPVHPFAR